METPQSETQSETSAARKLGPPTAMILLNRSEAGPRWLTLEPEDLRLLTQVLRWAGYKVPTVNIDDDVDRISDAVELFRPTVIINLVEHMFGDTSQVAAVAGLLDLYGYVYTGSGPRATSDCHDWERTQVLLAAAGLPTATADPSDAPTWRHHLCLLGNRELQFLPMCQRAPGGRGQQVTLSHIDKTLVQQMEQLAAHAWNTLSLRDLAQMDFQIGTTREPSIVAVTSTVDLFGPIFRTAASAHQDGFPAALVRLCHTCHERLPSEELVLNPLP